MLKVQTAPREPVIVPLEPVPEGQAARDVAHIAFRPWGTHALATAQAAAAAMLEAGHSAEIAGVAFTIAAARWGAISWEGIGDDAGEPIELSPAAVELVLSNSPEVYRAVDGEYVVPALLREAEKNG